MKIYSLLITSAVLLLYSCAKESNELTSCEQPSSESNHLWEKVEINGSEDVVVNSGEIDDKICISFVSAFGTIDESDEYIGTTNYSDYLDYTYQYKIPIQNGLTGFISNDTILYLNDPTNFADGYPFNLKDYGYPSNHRGQFPNRKKAYFAINDNSQVLIPIRSNEADDVSPKLLLLEYEITFTGPLGIIINSGTVIETSITSNFLEDTRLESITSIGSDFFVSYGSSNAAKTFKVESDGSITTSLNTAINDLFMNNDTIWSSELFGDMFYSVDLGETWSSSINFNHLFYLESNGCSHYHTSIEDRIVAFPSCTITALYELSHNETAFDIKLLKTEGLNGDITSVTLFNENVYVTTLSGVYKKPLEHFFEYE